MWPGPKRLIGGVNTGMTSVDPYQKCRKCTADPAAETNQDIRLFSRVVGGDTFFTLRLIGGSGHSESYCNIISSDLQEAARP